jgi:hypothetical protein
MPKLTLGKMLKTPFFKGKKKATRRSLFSMMLLHRFSGQFDNAKFRDRLSQFR